MFSAPDPALALGTNANIFCPLILYGKLKCYYGLSLLLITYNKPIAARY